MNGEGASSRDGVPRPTYYFTNPGARNTDRVLELVRERADELGIRKVIVGTTTGETGVKAARRLKGLDVIVVTHSTGFSRPDVQELREENRRAILDAGARVLTATHAFGGVGRAVRKKMRTYQTEEIIAYTLRIFGEGIKVACEMTLMVADAGLVRTDEEVIAVGGTSSGADAAAVLRPAHAQNFFDLQVLEVICMPRGR